MFEVMTHTIDNKHQTDESPIMRREKNPTHKQKQKSKLRSNLISD